VSTIQSQSPERYRANPFLLLLDCYVLDAIGQLPPRQRTALEQLEPRLQETFGSAGSWREVVEAQLGLAPTVALQIEMTWGAYQELAAAAGRASEAGDFVRAFVAQNFPALLEDDAASPSSTAAPGAKPKRKRRR
jgi:hypothetical protein